MFLLFGILSNLAVWQYSFASNCPVVQEEFRNGNQTSSTGYRLGGYFPDYEYYIPQCTAGGLFEILQCTSLNQSVPTPHRNPSIQCWCVDPVTGISVDNYGGYGLKNASECDNTISINTTALCEGRSEFPLTPGSCTFNDCSIGPPATLIVDCFYPRCLPSQRVVSGPECCNFTCVGPPDEPNCPVVQEEFRNGNQTSSTGYRLNRYFSGQSYYIPQCTAGGLFERVQCTSPNRSVHILSYFNSSVRCWCVDPVTGISVDYYYNTMYGPKNASECDDTINTRELCEGQSIFPLSPESCSYNDCSIGPPAPVIFDCFYPECGPSQTVVSGPGCCNYTCVETNGTIVYCFFGFRLTVAEEAITAVTVVAFVLVVIVIIIAVVVICCVVCKKPKVTKSAHPVAVNNAQFTALDEKVDLSKENQA